MTLVKLNVAGTIFITKKSTLTQSHFFKTLLDDEKFADKKEDGSYFIDEDPVLFRHLLNKLRHPNYQFPEADSTNLKQLIDFYEIPSVNANKKHKKIILEGYEFKIQDKDNDIRIFDNIIKIKTVCFDYDNKYYMNFYHNDEPVCEINLYVAELFDVINDKYILNANTIKLINKYTYNKIEIIKEKDSKFLCEGFVDYVIFS